MSSRLVLYLMASSFLESLANVFSTGIGIYPVTDPLCKAQGVIMQFAQQSEFCWIVAIAVHLFLGLFLHKRPKRKYEIITICIVLSLATIYTILPATTGDYGASGVWCWITSTSTGFIWRLIAFYVPLFLDIVIVIVLYALVFHSARSIFSNATLSDLVSTTSKKPGIPILRRLAAYPIILVLVWIFPILNRIQNWVNPDNQIFVLVLLQVLTAPLFGFINSMFYTFDASLSTRYRNTLRKHGMCTKCVGTSEEEVHQDDEADKYLDEVASSMESSGSGVVPAVSVASGSTTGTGHASTGSTGPDDHSYLPEMDVSVVTGASSKTGSNS
ncbi:slime mold cyclic amp receptor protein [Pelomyxa schiedti]|nr:slime mold cyclic amp receptor protein [Pelomyxa schiedti]